jgi:chaperonin GroEL (HSP60 family)
MQELAIDAVRCVMRVVEGEKREVEIKKYAKIEKIPGGAIEDCCVLNGVMFTKDVVNPSRMKRVVKNPRILLLDCPLEYKKGENQTNVELVNEADFAELLRQEEEVHPSLLCTQLEQLAQGTATGSPLLLAALQLTSMQPPSVPPMHAGNQEDGGSHTQVQPNCCYNREGPE